MFIGHHVGDQAVELIGRCRLRAYDAIQVATAVVINQTQSGLPPLSFVSADDELLLAARAEGLATENPNLHP